MQIFYPKFNRRSSGVLEDLVKDSDIDKFVTNLVPDVVMQHSNNRSTLAIGYRIKNFIDFGRMTDSHLVKEDEIIYISKK